MRTPTVGAAVLTTLAALSAVHLGGAAAAQARASFTIMFQAQHSGGCLEVAGGNTADGAAIQQWTCTPSADHHRWNVVAASDGYYTLRAVHSGKCLDVVNAGTGDGAPIWQWTCLNEDRPS